ncbi:hypothetical protein OBBRIDRAFT_306418 [Obba rivulosa]|uniref:Uncharacterized protein n=1 Tax=Obba rivulosa TaxID=1052685 RepID=A0A8E2J2U9_9APHY|nr:hypothetical protein OBBRIDRAFT_306418 [Obba rivulosa]
MAFRIRGVSLYDAAHRGIAYSLVGLFAWGVVMIGAVHRDNMRRGEGMGTTSGYAGADEAGGRE